VFSTRQLPNPNQVFVARAPRADYGLCDAGPWPELSAAARPTVALHTLRRLLQDAGFDRSRQGTPAWNPLADVIAPGAKVLLKPNWVLHENHSGQGLECLVTHATLLEAVLHYVAKAQPGSLVVGDAPLQGCDFESLLTASGMRSVAQQCQAAGVDVAVRDFRRVILPGGLIHQAKQAGDRSPDAYVLFDLGTDSILEPITAANTPFRVTMYDPQALQRTHGPGRHQYLVAREVIEADVVVNLPKLKTHKKAGLTGALKNMIGMNGHKEYLPHHRKGSPDTGGDCYARASWLKTAAEELLDRANGARGSMARYACSRAAAALLWWNRKAGSNGDVEGSWYGNDTVWRTCLDLQRILHYGRLDGTLAATPQRTVVHLTDAIVAGEGEGPLAPEPVPLGVLTMSLNAAAAEWVHALLMGIAPQAIPLIRESFQLPTRPLAGFLPAAIQIWVDGVACPLEAVFGQCGREFRLPRGWRRHCELAKLR
jgi:uncharacterized protein (DUF362 family)